MGSTMDVHPDLRNKIKEAFGDIIPLNYDMEVQDEND